MSRPWTAIEDKQLSELLKQGLLTEEIARKIPSRSFQSIRHRRAYLTGGLPKPKSEEPKLKQNDINKVLVASLQEALADTSSYKPAEAKIVGKGDTLVIHLTDLHAGKIVKDQEGKIIYNEEIFLHRIDKLCEQILKLLDNHIKRGVPITNAVILSTGDLANGEGIYATQAFEQEIAPPAQVMLVVDIMRKLITSLLNRGLHVSFYGVKGNHGRLAKEADPAANWDLMVYMVLDFWAKLVLKNPKLLIKYSETDYLTCLIRGHQYMIRHIAPEQADSPSGRVKFNEWARMYQAEGIVYGHWHHFGLFDVDGVRVFRGGSIVGGDSLSESMAKHSEPIQCVWGVNEARVSSFFYAVDLNELRSNK